MRARAGSKLLTLPVRHQGIELGRPVDLLLDLAARRAVGLEVHCGDEARRFLPLGAARVTDEATEAGSPLSLLDDVAFYRVRGTPLRALRGTDVTQGGRVLGTLADVAVAEDGTIPSLLVETPSGRARVRFGPAVSLAGDRKASAA